MADTLSRTPLLAAVLVVMVVVVAAAVLLRALSIAWFMLQLHGFTLTRSGTDLRTEYGLFTRISRTIPTPRIQSLTTTASPLHRWFNRQSIELRTVGGSGEDFDMGLGGGNTEGPEPVAGADDRRLPSTKPLEGDSPRHRPRARELGTDCSTGLASDL